MRLKQDLAILPPSRVHPFSPFARRSTTASLAFLFYLRSIGVRAQLLEAALVPALGTHPLFT